MGINLGFSSGCFNFDGSGLVVAVSGDCEPVILLSKQGAIWSLVSGNIRHSFFLFFLSLSFLRSLEN